MIRPRLEYLETLISIPIAACPVARQNAVRYHQYHITPSGFRPVTKDGVTKTHTHTLASRFFHIVTPSLLKAIITKYGVKSSKA
jgi:hypothetical protein